MDQPTTYAAQPVQIDAPAPDFEARSTHGTVRLSDFRGRWLVFFAHPADFTPVCTSEFIGFQKHRADFAALNCDLLGLSVDSVYAHLAWIRDIRDSFNVTIDFPIVEDISMAVARAYGMIHDASSSTAAVRALFVIDPSGMIRAISHYPMNVGRSVAEILRLVQALQQAEANDTVAPEGWTPGTPQMLPPPACQQDVPAGSDAGHWYVREAPGGHNGQQ